MNLEIVTTLGALVNAEAALGRVAAVPFDQDGGAKVRYHVVKLARLVAVETKHFYDERNALVELHGEGAPKTVPRTSPAWPTFAAAAEALAAVPVTIPWGPLTEAMVEPYTAITAADLVGLGPLYE
jgi:hypothetical protein